MKINIISKVKHTLRAQYRLHLTIKGKVFNTYGISRRLLTRMALNTQEADYWLLYKKGPLGLQERIIDSSENHIHQ